MNKKKIRPLSELYEEVKAFRRDPDFDSLDTAVAEWNGLVELTRDLVAAAKLDHEKAMTNQQALTEVAQTYGTFIYLLIMGGRSRSPKNDLTAVKQCGALLLKKYSFKYDPSWKQVSGLDD